MLFGGSLLIMTIAKKIMQNITVLIKINTFTL